MALIFALPAGATLGYLAWSGKLSEWTNRDGSRGIDQDRLAASSDPAAASGTEDDEGWDWPDSLEEPGDTDVAMSAEDEPAGEHPAKDELEQPTDQADREVAAVESEEIDLQDDAPEVDESLASEQAVVQAPDEAETPLDTSTAARAETSAAGTASARRGATATQDRAARSATSRTARTTPTDRRASASSGRRTAGSGESIRRSVRSGAAQDPARARSLASTADRHFSSGDFERAVNLYEQAARLDASEPTYQRQIGLSYISLGREARAMAPLRRYLQMNPNAPDRARIEGLIREHGG